MPKVGSCAGAIRTVISASWPRSAFAWLARFASQTFQSWPVSSLTFQ
jgi:hypothetical protein